MYRISGANDSDESPRLGIIHNDNLNVLQPEGNANVPCKMPWVLLREHDFVTKSPIHTVTIKGTDFYSIQACSVFTKMKIYLGQKAIENFLFVDSNRSVIIKVQGSFPRRGVMPRVCTVQLRKGLYTKKRHYHHYVVAIFVSEFTSFFLVLNLSFSMYKH